MSTIFKGSGVALVTPFSNGEVDYTALTRLIELQIISGTDAIIVCGTTGEAATLSQEERVEVIRFVVDRVNRRLPVIAGTGGNNTAAVIDFSRTAEALGVDGLLIVTPFYNKTTQKGLVAHYGAICEQVHIPIIVYNVPGRTGANMLPDTVIRLATEVPGIAGIKEASGNYAQASEIIRRAPEGFAVLSGDDELTLALMATGAHGVISVASNIVPGAVAALCEAVSQGDLAAARSLHHYLSPLYKACFVESNPIPVKAALSILELCEDTVRLPLAPATIGTRILLGDVLKELDQ